MSDSEDDTQISVKMPKNDDLAEEKPAKKPRKKMEVSERRRAASSANLAKAREARLRKKQEKLAAESETQAILNELVAEKKRAKEKRPDNVETVPAPVFGKPEKPTSDAGLRRQRKYVPLSESEASEESEEEEESEESEESSSEDSDVEFVLKPKKKAAAKKATGKKQEKAPKRSVIMEQMAAMQAKLDAMEKKEKKSKAAPVNVYFNQKGSGGEKKSALDAKVQWD